MAYWSSPSKCLIEYFWICTLLQVKLCGHATLAAAHALFSSGLVESSIIEFVTLSGVLIAKRVPEGNISSASKLENGETQDGFYIELDFPVDPTREFTSADSSEISKALKVDSIIDIQRTTIGDDLLVIAISILFHSCHCLTHQLSKI